MELDELAALLDVDVPHLEQYREASACRSTSSSEKTHPSQIETPTCWWSSRLRSLTNPSLLPSNPKPLKVLSGCSGISAESEVLKAGIQWQR